MIKIASDMLVNDLINHIGNKEISVKEVAEYFASSDRTIQKKIKALGFSWDSKQMKYIFSGSAEQESMVAFLTLEKVFSKGVIQQNNSKDVNKDNRGKSNNIKSFKASKNTIKNENFGGNGLDRVDEILSGRKVNKKYIGFYADADITSVLSSIEGRVKSELINECLRMVFKSKGLL